MMKTLNKKLINKKITKDNIITFVILKVILHKYHYLYAYQTIKCHTTNKI